MFSIIADNKTSNLEGNLRFLHFSHAEQLLLYIRYNLLNNLHFELSLRVLFYIVDNYHQPLSVSKKLIKLIDEIKTLANIRLKKSIDHLGFGLAGMKLFHRELAVLKEEKIELPTFQ